MAIAEIKFDPKQLINEITELEKVILPNILYKSLNRAVFRTSREDLRDATAKTFANPVPFTLKSFLYDKPQQTANFLESRIYIRDDAPKGNAPADYLSPQITGGSVWRTRFQRRLKARGFLGGSQGEYMIPGHLAVNSGNQIYKSAGKKKFTPGEYTKALWGISGFEDLRLSGKYGRKNYRTAGSYVFVPKDLDSMADWSDELAARASMVRSLNDGMLPPPGIYQVMKSSLRQKFFMIDNVPTVGRKFDFLEPAKDEVEKSFREHLLKNLKR